MRAKGRESVAQPTRSDEVANRLRQAILTGSLPPGTRLIEQELAQDLAVSRIPIREALQRLSEEGLVRRIPNHGAFVYSPTKEEIEQISSLRVVLECFVVERVLERWEDAHEMRLRDIVNQMRQVSPQDVRQVYELDYAFHHTLWQIADHDLLLEVTAGLRGRISAFLYEANGALTDEELDVHIDSHDTFIDVLKEQDLAAIHAEVEQHILGAKVRILNYLAHTETSPAKQ